MSRLSLNVLPNTQRDEHTGIGAISLFALIVILCLAVLSVLTVTTAHSSLVLSLRQAAAMQEIYLNETAAQTFVADVDRTLQASGGAGTAGLEGELSQLCSNAEQAADGQVEAHARISGDSIVADFACEGGRTLHVILTVDSNGTYRIDSWRMKAIENEEQPMGTLYLGD